MQLRGSKSCRWMAEMPAIGIKAVQRPRFIDAASVTGSTSDAQLEHAKRRSRRMRTQRRGSHSVETHDFADMHSSYLGWLYLHLSAARRLSTLQVVCVCGLHTTKAETGSLMRGLEGLA